MPTNDFLEIATAGGANVELQAAYVADADRTGFFPDGGIPDANQHGKMFRQSSVIAHMIAQAVCDITGKDMIDDANAAVQLANYKLMLALSGSTQSYVAAAGTVNAITIAPGGPAAYKPGETWWFIQTGANTGAATFNRDGIAAKAIALPNGAALSGGEIPAGILTGVKYQATADKFVLLTQTSSVPTFGEIIGPGAGNVAIPAGARECVLEFCGGGGGGGTGDGGAGGPSGTGQSGGAGGDSTVNGVVAKGGGGGSAGLAAGNIYGGDGGHGGAGAGTSYRGQGGISGFWAPAAGTQGNNGGTGGSSFFGGGGAQIAAGAQPGGYGAGGGAGQTGNSASYSGAGGGGAETRRVVLGAAALAALAGNIAYNLGAGGTAGVQAGNFPGAVGGPGYLRYQFIF